MNQYDFPHLTHLNQILPAITGGKEFIVVDKGDYKVINYVMMGNETFPPVTDEHSAIRRECRGIICDPSGNVISRRLHKFFNVGEREETLPDNIDISQPHIIMEKLDGSMVTPIPLIVLGQKIFRWGTKMGITEVSMQAEEFVARHPNYTEFVELLDDRSQTPIFEWCSRQNTIVVDHPEDRLVLIAVRNINTGEYWSYGQMLTYAESYNLDVVGRLVGRVENMEYLLEKASTLEGEEGWVIRFDDGHMLKVKGQWYVNLHRVKDNLSSEKGVLNVIFNQNIDDLKPFMLKEDLQRLEEYETNVVAGISKTITYLERYLEYVKENYDRKTFALDVAPALEPMTRAILFSCWDGKNSIDDTVRATIMKSLNKQDKIDEARHLWGGYEWKQKIRNGND